MLQTLARRDDVAELTRGYGMVVVDECHHIPAAAFEHAVRQIPARTWLGLTATPYRLDRLDDLIGLQLGPVRHTVAGPGGEQATLEEGATGVDAPAPRLVVHRTGFRYTGDAIPTDPGGMAAIYRAMAADSPRNAQIVADVCAALSAGRNCLVLTGRVGHAETLGEFLRDRGRNPVVLKGGMGVEARREALRRLEDEVRGLLVVATGAYVGEGFDCPALDTLFLASPIAFKGRLVQYVGRILRSYAGKTEAVVHDYHDDATPVLASSLAKRAPGYTSLGFPDPRRQQ